LKEPPPPPPLPLDDGVPPVASCTVAFRHFFVLNYVIRLLSLKVLVIILSFRKERTFERTIQLSREECTFERSLQLSDGNFFMDDEFESITCRLSL
jgi:hypothetical protein